MAEEIEQQQQSGAGAEQEQSAAREAAKWRTKLRTAEAEIDALAAQLSTWQQREVQRLAAARLADPSDLTEIGRVQVDQLLGEDGLVDEEKVNAAVDALLAARPYLQKDDEPVSNFDGGIRGAAVQQPTTWSALLSGGRQ